MVPHRLLDRLLRGPTALLGPCTPHGLLRMQSAVLCDYLLRAKIKNSKLLGFLNKTAPSATIFARQIIPGHRYQVLLELNYVRKLGVPLSSPLDADLPDSLLGSNILLLQMSKALFLSQVHCLSWSHSEPLRNLIPCQLLRQQLLKQTDGRGGHARNRHLALFR